MSPTSSAAVLKEERLLSAAKPTAAIVRLLPSSDGERQSAGAGPKLRQ